jgi:dTDP-glucose 4,6-dehydratase
MRTILVTGGLGFIGSYFVELALAKGYRVINMDKKTYAARTDLTFDRHPQYEFIEADICTITHLPPNVDTIVNFAAESHVDNSIVANQVFFESNTRGVYNLLEIIRAKDVTDRPMFVHISTDEVYGSMMEGSATENDRLNPSSPYSATKAAADQLILAWAKTYDIKYQICRSCNNYGYGQYPEKLFAKTVAHLANDKKMTVHGDGSYVREWLYAEDNVRAILEIMERGAQNEIYNISANEEHSVMDVVEMIVEVMKPGENWNDWVERIPNRQGQDGRYAIDCTKLRQLGWKPEMTVKQYIPEYVALYRTHHAA